MPNFHDYGLVEGHYPRGRLRHPRLPVLAARIRAAPSALAGDHHALRRDAQLRPQLRVRACVRKVTPEERARLDLSSWRVAGNAAEPVHRETIERFTEMFAPCGFRLEAFYPSFGLAEATLMVSAGGPKPRAPLFITARASALEQERRVVEVAPDEPGARSSSAAASPSPTLRSPSSIRRLTAAARQTSSAKSG